MGTITAQSIITNAAIVLQDTTNVQWPTAELLSWLSDGQRQIVLAKPDAYSEIDNITTVAGTKQSIPSGWNRLLDIFRNTGADGNTPGRAITKVNRRVLDMQTPNWHTGTPANEALHFVFDPRTPRTFYLFPPVAAGRRIEASGSVSPPAPATLASPIALDDVYAPVLHDYILYRAYTKDNGDGNTTRAGLHLQSFNAALAAKVATDATNDAMQQPAQGKM